MSYNLPRHLDKLVSTTSGDTGIGWPWQLAKDAMLRFKPRDQIPDKSQIWDIACFTESTAFSFQPRVAMFCCQPLFEYPQVIVYLIRG